MRRQQIFATTTATLCQTKRVIGSVETDRLVLRSITVDDVDLLVDLDSDPEVMRYRTGPATGNRTRRSRVRDHPSRVRGPESVHEAAVKVSPRTHRMTASTGARNTHTRRYRQPCRRKADFRAPASDVLDADIEVHVRDGKLTLVAVLSWRAQGLPKV